MYIPKTTIGRVNDGKPNAIYIGRPGKGQSGYFGNPYRLVQERDRNKIFSLALIYFQDRVFTDDVFADAVKGLYGKHLQCFCAPKLCHGWALAQLAAALNGDSEECEYWMVKIMEALNT